MAASGSDTIACTLMGDNYADRLAWIADLHRRALLASRREGRSLILNYRLEAAADVEELVRQESACCAFLTFDVTKHDSEVVLTITAPPDAEAMLDEVFAPFEQGSACSCSASGMSTCSPPRKLRNGLGFAAAGLSSLALACGVCCIVPVLAPAAAAGVVGAALAFTASFHGIATAFATATVAIAWGAIVLRRGKPVSRGEFAVAIAATLILVAALSWPHFEGWISG